MDDKNCVNNSLEQTGTVKLVIKLSFVQTSKQVLKVGHKLNLLMRSLAQGLVMTKVCIKKKNQKQDKVNYAVSERDDRLY